MKPYRSFPICLALAAALAASGASAQSSVTTSPFRTSSATHTDGRAPLTLAQSGNVEVYLMVEQLQQEVRELRGMVEQQAHAIEQINSQQRDRYIDLDKRLQDMDKRLAQPGSQAPQSTAVPVLPAPGPAAQPQTSAPVPNPAPGATPPSGQEQAPATSGSAGEDIAESGAPVSDAQKKAYEQAYDLIRQRQFDKAVDALHAFINQYPSSDLTVNAYYWLGEVYLVMPKLEQAKQAFTVVISRYANHRKASDAAYKLGVALDRLGESARAKEQLSNTVKKYPNSAAAGLARDYLKKMP